jgi:hypothetical protein
VAKPRASPKAPITLEGRKLAGQNGAKIVERICDDAAAGDAHAQRLFMTFLYPRSRLVDQSIECEPIKTVEEAT